MPRLFLLANTLFLTLLACSSNTESASSMYWVSTLSECEVDYSADTIIELDLVPYEQLPNDVFVQYCFGGLWLNSTQLMIGEEILCPYSIDSDSPYLFSLYRDIPMDGVVARFRNYFMDSLDLHLSPLQLTMICDTYQCLDDEMGYERVSDFSDLDFEQGFSLITQSYHCFGSSNEPRLYLKPIGEDYKLQYIGSPANRALEIDEYRYQELVLGITDAYEVIKNDDEDCTAWSHYYLKAGNKILKFTDSNCSVDPLDDFLNEFFLDTEDPIG